MKRLLCLVIVKSPLRGVSRRDYLKLREHKLLGVVSYPKGVLAARERAVEAVHRGVRRCVSADRPMRWFTPSHLLSSLMAECTLCGLASQARGLQGPLVKGYLMLSC